jgi:O-acetyl-ADP-ribose deacetylase (regulator of RNase III)
MLSTLIEMLLQEMPEYLAFAQSFQKSTPPDTDARHALFRSLMNLRPAIPLQRDYLRIQDAYLGIVLREKGVVPLASLADNDGENEILWHGDITRLAVDAIVNAANSKLLGCRYPCHGCIDNAIHTAAGSQLREACHRSMKETPPPNGEEQTGLARITDAYNLPARHVIHTVGPIIHGSVRQEDRDSLASCYRSCLELAEAHKLSSIAFCCISTGEYRFPQEEAAQTAIQTVRQYLSRSRHNMKVVFNVFKESDVRIYRALARTAESFEGSPPGE